MRRALAGGPLDGALVAVAATDAIDALARGRARLRGAALARISDGICTAKSSSSSPTPSSIGPVSEVIRLGRIGYVNMAPVFYRLEADVEEVVGVPTELNRQLVAGELDVAPISSIEYARNADRLRLLPRLCVSSEGAVESIQLVSKTPLQRIRTVAVTPESATSVVLTKVLLPDADSRAARRGGRGEAADRRRGAPLGVRGSDAASRPRPALARAHWAADGFRRLGGARADAPRARPARGRARRVGPRPRAPSPSSSRYESAERYGYPAGFLARYFEKLRYRFGPRERAGLYTFLELARDVGELAEVPELRFVVAGAAV